jgi:hypothetical protein
MKRWAALTVLFYVFLLTLLAAPVLAAAMWQGRTGSPYAATYSFRDAIEVYAQSRFRVIADVGEAQASWLAQEG